MMIRNPYLLGCIRRLYNVPRGTLYNLPVGQQTGAIFALHYMRSYVKSQDV